MNPQPSACQIDPADPWVARARSYHRQALRLGLISLAMSLAFWAAAMCVAAGVVGALARCVTNRWLVLLAWLMVIAAARGLLFAPLAWWGGYRLEHRFELSNETLAGWLWRQTKAAMVGAAIGLPFMLGFFVLLWYSGRLWWLYVFVGSELVSIGLARVFPVWILPLFYPTKPLEDADLTRRLERMAEGTGLRISGVYRVALSRSTRKANAALAGIGRTRRVLLGDTLLDSMTPEEIESVFAHELGHHVLGHIRLGLLVGTAASAVSVGIVWLLMDPVRSQWPASLARLPLVALVMGLIGLAGQPLSNWLSRRWERQADRFELDKIGQAGPVMSSLVRLARQNLSDPFPPRWVEVLFYSHPSIGHRLQSARQWEVDNVPNRHFAKVQWEHRPG